VCNELVALKQRHQLDTGVRYKSKIDLAKYLRPLVKLLDPVSEDTIIHHSDGTKKKLLLSAKESLEGYPIQPEDGEVKMFLKADKGHIFDDDESPEFGAPRCIQYRNKRYCLRLATYLHPVENHVYRCTDNSNSPCFAKSRNLTQRGGDLWKKFNNFQNPTIICIDHSKFDAHCNKQLLKVEHNFYKRCFRNREKPELSALLAMQMVNKGVTKHGTRYVTAATRMSGDQNTGLGNSIINYAMLKAYADYNGWDACFYVDGDDSVMIVEGDVNPTPDFFTQFGMKTKIECVTKEFRKLEFCQTRPVFDGIAWRLVRNPFRMLARIPWAVRDIVPTIKNKYLRSVGLCEMALGVGLPIGQYIGNTLSKLGKGYMITGNHHRAQKEYIRPSKVTLIPPSYEARIEYELTWDVSIADQLRIEASGVQLPELGDCLSFDEDPFR
jgi:hypothetical protein